MLPIIVSALTDLVENVIKSFLPETAEDKLSKIKLAIQQQVVENELFKAQIAVNTEEAKSDNLFVAGWRPAVGWICAASFAWQFAALPILLFLSSLIGHPIQVPSFDFNTMATVLMGMLGMGGLRTYEKINGVKK